MSNYIVFKRQELGDIIGNFPRNMTTGLLFSGDRIDCIDEGVAVVDNDTVIGLATLAPEGEYGSGNGIPAIIGLYILPSMRGRGYGKKLLATTIKRCQERGFEQVRIDAVSEGMISLIDSLSPEQRKILQVVDWSICYVPLE